MDGPIPQRWAPYLLSVFRIVVAILFIAHGTQKLFGVPSAEPRPTVALFSLLGLAGVLETFGGRCCCSGSSRGRWRSCWPGRWRPRTS